MVEHATAIDASALPARRRWFAADGSLRLERSTAIAAWAFLSSLVIVWAAAWIALGLFGHSATESIVFDPSRLSQPFHSAVANFLVAPAARWDAIWYLAIAHVGYLHFQWSAFFPLYPLLIHAGFALGAQPLLVGLLISFVSMLVGLTILHRLALLDLGSRAAWLTVMLMALFPMAFYLSADYTESLFMVLTVGAVYAARLDAWGWAGVLGGLASATRSDGILVAVPLVLLYLYGPRRSRPSLRPGTWWKPRYRVTLSAAWLILVPAGLAAYLGYLTVTHDAPLAPFQAVDIYWGRSFAGPFGAVVRALGALPGDLTRLFTGTATPFGVGDPLTWESHDLIDLAFVAVAFGALIACWRRIPFAYFAYVAVMLVFALSFPREIEPLASAPRYLLGMFPLFIGAASWLAMRGRWATAVLGLSAVLLALFSGLWGMWAWVA